MFSTTHATCPISPNKIREIQNLRPVFCFISISPYVCSQSQNSPSTLTVDTWLISYTHIISKQILKCQYCNAENT